MEHNKKKKSKMPPRYNEHLSNENSSNERYLQPAVMIKYINEDPDITYLC